MAAAQARPVILHVYEFTTIGERTNAALRSLDLGVYHTGVEVSGVEYSFNDAGVFRTRPRAVSMGPDAACRHTAAITVGTHRGTANDVAGAVNALKTGDFAPGTSLTT